NLLTIVTAFAFLFTISSCGGNGEQTSTTTESLEAPAIEPESTTQPDSQVSNVLELEGNDQMQFNKKEFRVKAGEEITLTLKHVGTIAKTAMGHNFVLLKQGTDLGAFEQKALTAKDTDYIPKSESASIIAHTKLLGGG